MTGGSTGTAHKVWIVSTLPRKCPFNTLSVRILAMIIIIIIVVVKVVTTHVALHLADKVIEFLLLFPNWRRQQCLGSAKVIVVVVVVVVAAVLLSSH